MQKEITNEAIKLLLVEDDNVDAELFIDALNACLEVEYFTTHAETQARALEILDDDAEFDIILTDLHLPDSSGLDTFRDIYQQSVDTPVVVLTGLDDSKLSLEALKEGAQDYISKGDINPQMLQRVIRYSIERQRMQSKITADERRLRIITEASLNGLVVVDDKRRIKYINPAAKRLLSRLTGIVPKEKLPYGVNKSNEKQTLSTELAGQEMPLTVEMHVTEIAWERQEAFLVTLLDISDRMEAEKSKSEAESLKNIQHLAGAIAHEFSQPLQVLSHSLDFLAEEEEAPSDRIMVCRNMVARTINLVRHLRSIVILQKQPYLSDEILDIIGSSDYQAPLEIDKDKII